MIDYDRLRSRLGNFYKEMVENRDLKVKWEIRQSRDSLWENNDQNIMMEKFQILFVEFFFEYELLCYETNDGKNSKHKNPPFNSSEVEFLRKRFNERSDDNILNGWEKFDDEIFSISEEWDNSISGEWDGIVDTSFYLKVLSQPGIKIRNPWTDSDDK